MPAKKTFHASPAVLSGQSGRRTCPKAPCTPPDPRHPPTGSARRPRGCGGALGRRPPVSLKSRRKFWDSCFAACSLNNLMISRIVGNGGRRKALSVPEPAMQPRATVPILPPTFRAALKSSAEKEVGGRERGNHQGPPPSPPYWSDVPRRKR